MNTMDASNKIERAYTCQDVRAQEFAMISKFGSHINSIDKGDIKIPTKFLWK